MLRTPEFSKAIPPHVQTEILRIANSLRILNRLIRNAYGLKFSCRKHVCNQRF